MSKKLNDLATSTHVVPLPGTFEAVKAFCEEYSQKEGPEATLGTLPAAIAAGVGEFVSPTLPRGLRLNTAEEVWEADLATQTVRLVPAPEAGNPALIVSGHPGTVEILRGLFPSAEVVVGNVDAEVVRGQVVVGTLPPHLAAEAEAYVPVAVADFDYSKDGDLKGDELVARLVIHDPIRVVVE